MKGYRAKVPFFLLTFSSRRHTLPTVGDFFMVKPM